MNNPNLESELKKLGLSDKEARVYLALLELGIAGVLKISNKSKVNRATTYVILESLKKQGAISVLEQNKKVVFAAESPRTLLQLFKKQEQELREKENEFKKAIPELEALFNLAVEKPKVRFFEGKEGVRTIREDILNSKVKILKEINSREYVEQIRALFSDEENLEFLKKQEGCGMIIRSIYTDERGPRETFKLKGDRRFVPKNTFPFSGDILIYGEKTAFTTLRGKIITIIIESKEIADTMRLVFELAWLGAENFEKK